MPYKKGNKIANTDWTPNSPQGKAYIADGWTYIPPTTSSQVNKQPSSTTETNQSQGGTAPSWNWKTRIVYSANGNPKEVPANEYDNYILNGWTNTPVQNNQGQSNQGNENQSSGDTPSIDTGDSALNQLLQQTQQFLDKLIQQGQTINPQIEITPEQTAQFLTQAQKEISPYYSTQMKLAREGLLRDAGYTSDEIEQSEAETEKKYGQNLRNIGSNAAESGMALSGGRQLDEQNLAEDTQSAIDQNRRLQEYNMGNKARTFAGEWGGEDLPSFSYSSAPKVTAGFGKFTRSLDTKPFYNISDSVYQGLKGSKDYEQEVEQRTRGSELEQAWRTKKENEARSLTL